MHWNYRVVEKNKNNQISFEVVEVYYSDEGEIDSWCDCANSILIWGNYDDLKGAATSIQKAFEKPILRVLSDDSLEEIC